jgi:hypothetical protein
MDVRLVVGGLLTRNAVLSRLLLNYADRLERGLGHCTVPAPCFIVPTWSADQPPSAPFGSRLLTVHAHMSRSDPGCHDTLDAIMLLLHVVLTDDHAGSSITARRLSTPADVAASDLDTVSRLGCWDIAPVPSWGPEADQRRLLPWPDCGAVLATGALTPGTVNVN